MFCSTSYGLTVGSQGTLQSRQIQQSEPSALIVRRQSLIPGIWYLIADCEVCGIKHIVASDPSNGNQSLPKAIYQSECPGCLRIGLYAAGELERYQHAESPRQLLISS